MKQRIILAIALIWFSGCGPDLSRYQPLKEPHIIERAPQKVISVRIKGDPNTAAPVAFALLYKTYYSLPGVTKSLNAPAPRARWSSEKTPEPKPDWTGIYAVPVPDTAVLPPQKNPVNEAGTVTMEMWKYGQVAEILHVGPYSEEGPAIERLQRFIRQQGYRIVGPPEEEYVKGPGMIFRGNAAKYQTIIRYPVKKR